MLLLTWKLILYKFDVSTLEGQEIDVEGDKSQVLNAEEEENIVVEKLDENCERYLTNQVLSVLPNESGRLGIR